MLSVTMTAGILGEELIGKGKLQGLEHVSSVTPAIFQYSAVGAVSEGLDLIMI